MAIRAKFTGYYTLRNLVLLPFTTLVLLTGLFLMFLNYIGDKSKKVLQSWERNPVIRVDGHWKYYHAKE